MNKSLWLVRLLSSHGKLSKQEILNAWSREDEHGRPMAPSTFYDNRRYLEERYNIRIICRGGLYSIERTTHCDHPIVEQMLQPEGADVLNQQASAMGGLHWIPMLVEAMEKRQLLQMHYTPYDKGPFVTMLSPYSLYPIRGWCYVVGHSSAHNAVRNFALDRIEHLQLLPTHFRRAADFDAREYFRHSFGAYGGSDVKAERLRLQTDTLTAAYLRQRPLHASQHEVEGEAADGSVCFEMDVALTRDLVKELLSFGPALRVTYPPHLCQTLAEQLRRAADAYESE